MQAAEITAWARGLRPTDGSGYPRALGVRHDPIWSAGWPRWSHGGNGRLRRVSPIASGRSDGPLSDHRAGGQAAQRELVFMVESECDAGGFRSTLSVAAPFVWRCLTRLPVAPVFHTPLIEPDMQICRIRLSDKTSRLHPRRAATKLG